MTKVGKLFGREPSVPWMPARFEIAILGGKRLVSGWEYRGLGLYLSSWTRARYVRKDGTRKLYSLWATIHLNTGHLVRAFRDLNFERMLVSVTALAELAEWDFDGLEGWKNTCPDIQDRLQEWHERHGLGAEAGGGDTFPEIARQIVMARSS